MRILASLVCLLAASGVARAQPEDADTQAARRHFAAASKLYDAGRYAEAIREFETARDLKAAPAFEFNIAKCFERLERWSEAADAFERYLAASPDAHDAEQVRARIATLRARVPAIAPPRETPVARPGPPPIVERAPARRYRAAAIGVAGAALVCAIVAGALVGSVASDYNTQQRVCATRPCGPADWSGMETRANAGYALFGLAAAAAAVDVALWVLDARQARRARAWLAPGSGGALVRF